MSNYITCPISFYLKDGAGLNKKKINSFGVTPNQVKIAKDFFHHKSLFGNHSSFEAAIFQKTFGSDYFLDWDFRDETLAKKHISSLPDINPDFTFNIHDTVDGISGNLDYAKTFIKKDPEIFEIEEQILKVSRQYFKRKPKYLKEIQRVVKILQSDITQFSIFGGFITHGEETRPFHIFIAFIDDKYAIMFSNIPSPIEAYGDQGFTTYNYMTIFSKIRDVPNFRRLPITTLRKIKDFELERQLKIGDYFKEYYKLIFENNVSNFGIKYTVDKLQEVA